MPEGTKVARCVADVKAKAKAGTNAYAVCQAATGQSYATGKPLGTKKSSKPAHLAEMKKHGL